MASLPPWVGLGPGIALPFHFTYIEHSEVSGDHATLPELPSSRQGCSCDGECTLASCDCVRRNPLGELVDGHGRFLPVLHGLDYDATLFECSPACSCGGSCSNSVTCKPPRQGLVLQRAEGKGLGAFAAAAIPLGTFVCEYAGEFVTAAEARERLAEYDSTGVGHALLVVREVLPSRTAALRTQIDATRRGNVARFINHKCGGGNLEAVTVRNCSDLVPRVALFANADIAAGEEVLYAYGPPNPGPGQRRCSCGSAACLGHLPHEAV